MTNHKAIIITGAGSGIGQAAAIQLAAAGYDTVLAARREPTLHVTREQCLSATADTPSPAASHIVVADISEATACQKLVTACIERFGRIDGIVHAAGHAPLGPIADTSPDLVATCLATNLAAAANLAHFAWAELVKSKGIVVNVSSLASIDPFPGFSIYAAAKVGVNMFTQCIAREGAELGLRAVAVAPGAVETPMLRGLFDEAMLPEDKTLAPDDVANVIVECITGKRTFTAGQTIEVPSPA